MSEEILKALTQLFAIITRQDGGATTVERNFIIRFFKQELDLDSVNEYVELYDQLSLFGQEDKNETKLTSVKDSVKTLSICKKINKTLTQKQKVVVLIRLLELVSSDKNFTPQRMSIIDTVSTVFNIEKDEYELIESFVISEKSLKLNLLNLLVVNSFRLSGHELTKHLYAEQLNGEILFIRIKSVDMYFLRYLGTDDLLLNSQLIKPEQVYLFSHGSILKLPKSSPVYYSDAVGIFVAGLKTTPLSFQAKNLEYKFSNGNIGLRDVNIAEGPGKLIGIMGGSGAGKTTLLNVLAGIETPTKGEVLINGRNLHRENNDLEGVVGYIAQDDILLEDLTVFENLYYNAKLCFRNLSEEQIEKRVMDVLMSLGLDHIRDIKVGNVLNKKISGGQRKRLNIALELIREPAVMFVDEPTSGLSSRDSENVIDLLKELSLKGKLIFVVIHQPSSDIYKMFDKMFILDTGGYPIYYGNPVEAVVYFKVATNQVDSQRGQCPTCGNVNPEQIFNIIEAKVVDEYGQFTNKRKMTPPQWNEQYLKKFRLEDVPPVKEAPPKGLNLPPLLQQMYIFTKRDFLSKISNGQYLVINLLEAPLLAFLLAFIVRYQNDPDKGTYTYRYNDNIPAYILVGVLVAVFMGLTVSAEEIIRDRKLQKRESFLNLSRTSYLFSKIIILFTLSAIQTLTFALIGNTILEVREMTLSYWAVLFSLSCFANMLGLNISASFNSVVTIYITIPLLIIPQMILSGLIFNFDKLNSSISTKGTVPVIADVIAARWAFEALAVEQYTNNRFQAPYYELDKEASKAYYKYSYLIPKVEEKLEDAIRYSQSKNDSLRRLVPVALQIVQEEISKEKYREGMIFDLSRDLQPGNFNEAAAEKIRQYLTGLKTYYNTRYNKADEFRERKISEMQAGKSYDLTQTKNLYYNEALADLVKNANAKQKILEYKGKLLQQLDPIYSDSEPENMLDYRSHFLAPQKQFLGAYISTFYFNIVVIWLMSAILYVTLYFESFKWLIDRLGKLRFGFLDKFFQGQKQRREAGKLATSIRKNPEAEKVRSEKKLVTG
jgi:ABC transport system ATP-binding/permease protein